MKTHLEYHSPTHQILDAYRKTIKDQTGIDVALKGRKRDKTDLLKIFCKHARYNLKLGSGRIGNYLKRDHATILHACKTYDQLYIGDKEFRHKAEFFMDRFDSIDGKSRKKPNMEELMKLASAASENTIGEWLRYIRSTQLIKETSVEYETVTND